MTSEEILKVLAAQMDGMRESFGASFELLEDYWAMADARLSAFSSEKMWAVVIEVVGYNRAGEYSLRAWVFGNCLKSEDEYYDFERTILTVPDAWNRHNEANDWGIARDGFAFRWRGNRFDLAPSVEDLASAGIELSRREIENGQLTPEQMLRYVCEIWDHPFFMSEDALRDSMLQHAILFKWQYDEATERSWYENECGEFDEQPLPSTVLELLLQTRDWTHPKHGGDPEEDDFEISPREAFATLAETIATRDLAVWNAQDTSKFNSHWRHWAQVEVDVERVQSEKIEAAKVAFRAYAEEVPRESRAQFLEQLRPTIQTAPSVFEWGEFVSIGSDNQRIAVFRELVEELDAMLAQLKKSNSENS